MVDSKNDESKSRLAYTTAKEKLLVFGVPEEQIDPLLKNLGDESVPQELHAISDKARMTRLSPVEGIVIQRDAVPGNLYDNNDVLMVIAPLDHLFVWVNVYEADQARVAMNQEMEIRFPYLDKTLVGKVEYVANEVSKDTRAIQIRASIPNVDGKLKADMLVRPTLKIPPEPGQTVIPRLAMVVMNGNEYAFVQKDQEIPARRTSCSSSGGSSSSPRSAMTTSSSRPGSSPANTSPPTEAWSLPSSMKTSKWSRRGCRSNETCQCTL